MSLDFSPCRLPPFQHQREDTETLTQRPFVFVASEMRTGKTKIVIDAAQFLYEAGAIDTVVVITPTPVRDVWYDPELGELKKHLWDRVRAHVTEFHSRTRAWSHGDTNWVNGKPPLEWVITNYEFIRSAAQLNKLFHACTLKTLLVLDESSFVKSFSSQQTRACYALRKRCGRVVLLNGTPIFHSPLDLFSQGNLLHPTILDCPYITLFKARYAIQSPVLTHGGKPLVRTITKGKWSKDIVIQEVSGWTNLEDLERRFKPYTIRRMQADCLDLPPKLDPVTLTAALEPATWKLYKQMRDEFVVWLNSGQVITSATAAIKSLRLSQMTGGFLKGVEEALVEDPDLITDTELATLVEGIYGQSRNIAQRTESIAQENSTYTPNDRVVSTGGLNKITASNGDDDIGQQTTICLTDVAVEIGREKLDVLLWFIEQQLEKDPNLHLVAWSRFRAEVIRAERDVKRKFPQFETAIILGEQKKADRLRALSLLKPETSPKGPVFVAGIEGTGSFGLDMCAAHTCVTMSSGYSSGRVVQTLDRVYGPNQKFPIAYYNIIATGPKGQKTIDHDILTTRLNGENIALRTAAAWVKAVRGE